MSFEPIDPAMKSWVESANDPACDFSLHNLPYGVFTVGPRPARRVGVAIGDFILDLATAWPELVPVKGDLGAKLAEDCFARPSLNALIAKGPRTWSYVRRKVSDWLSSDLTVLQDNSSLRNRVMVPMKDATLYLPVEIGDYTDFYSSQHHAFNVGSMFRDPANALLPNWKHIPIGYHGRSSSIVVSGTPVKRSLGQTKPDDQPAPSFGPCKALDFELEVGFIAGVPNTLGSPIPISNAADHIFGMLLVNDWSARDIQKWEYVPLGPFLAKDFATSVSPWVVPLDALAPYRVRTPRAPGDPAVLPYLDGAWDWNLDLNLEVTLSSALMREKNLPPQRITHVNFRDMYWNMCQQLAHQTSNGCNIRVGDLYASGTVSGPTEDSRGSLLEITWGGKNPLKLPTGEERRFLMDGDEIIMRGWCGGDGKLPRVGFGQVCGTIVAS